MDLIRTATSALLAAALLASLAWSGASRASDDRDTLAAAPARALVTKYLCQKCYGGHWCTVYACYCYTDAMAWYDAQEGTARVITQK